MPNFYWRVHPDDALPFTIMWDGQPIVRIKTLYHAACAVSDLNEFADGDPHGFEPLIADAATKPDDHYVMLLDLDEYSAEPQVGDIAESCDGLIIRTPYGDWQLPLLDAVRFSHGLNMMVHHTLTRPWNEDDNSSIISRGIAAENAAAHTYLRGL